MPGGPGQFPFSCAVSGLRPLQRPANSPRSPPPHSSQISASAVQAFPIHNTTLCALLPCPLPAACTRSLRPSPRRPRPSAVNSPGHERCQRHAAHRGVFWPTSWTAARRCQHGTTAATRVQPRDLRRRCLREGCRQGYVCALLLFSPSRSRILHLPTPTMPSTLPKLAMNNNCLTRHDSYTPHHLLPPLLHVHLSPDPRPSRPHPTGH